MIITKFRFANLNLAKTLIWWLCSEEFSSYFHRVSGECPPTPPSPLPLFGSSKTISRIE